MISPTVRQTSLFYLAFAHQAALIKDDLLDPIDALLDDPVLVELVRQALVGRSPRSLTMGRGTVAPDRLLRCCALKHLKGWSLRELERELRGSLVYRRFTRFDEAPIPDFSTFCRTFSSLGPAVSHDIHQRVVALAQQARVAPGRKLRVDTTVVESNVHHPADSTLLQDGIRVLTRAVKCIAAECVSGTVNIVDHARSAKWRVLEIHRAARALTEAGRARLTDGYRKLVDLTRNVVAKAEQVTQDLSSGAAPIVGAVVPVLAAEAAICHYAPLVQRVIAQTEARVFGGNTHVPGKVLSLFEEHTVAIRKGKAHKPTEFGRLVRLDEVEHGIVSGYHVQEGNPTDCDAWLPALDNHAATFGRAPRMATGDRGFFSAKNEHDAKERGVAQVVLPARGPLSQARTVLQKQLWFRRALRWRGWIEARIATLKHRFGMVRAHYKGDWGFQRWVGWSVITNNLVAIARVQSRRQAKRDAAKNTSAH